MGAREPKWRSDHGATTKRFGCLLFANLLMVLSQTTSGTCVLVGTRPQHSLAQHSPTQIQPSQVEPSPAQFSQGLLHLMYKLGVNSSKTK